MMEPTRETKQTGEAKGFCIAVDGPAGAGKSTVARAAAARLGFLYADTGALYRAMALYFLRQGIAAEDEAAIAAACGKVDVTLSYDGQGAQQVFLNGENVTGLIRSEAVGNMASASSACAPVRQKLLELQRSLAAAHNVIMDGRDIGTCVLPDAQVKIYLTADPHVRALRRYKELEQKGQTCNLEEIEQDIKERDYRDMHREIAPLRQAPDALYVDSSHMTMEEVVRTIAEAAQRKRREMEAGQ